MIVYEDKGNSFFAEKRAEFEVGPHLHHHIELVYILHGELEAIVNDKVYHAQSGDVIVVFPNQIHSFHDKTPLQGHIVIASPNDFPEFDTLFKSFLPVCPLVHPESEEIAHLFAQLSLGFDSAPLYYRELLRGYSLALLSLLMPLLEFYPHNALNLSTAQQILLYCDDHYAEPLSLEVLARQFGVNRFYISHLFSDKIKITFHSYLHMRRIQAAMQLLQQKDCSITEVAYVTGYNNIRSFNRRFVAATGFTPTEYRQQAHNAAVK